MSTRYVWGKYNRDVQYYTDYRYVEQRTNIGSVDRVTGNNGYITIASGITISQSSGTVSLSGSRSYLLEDYSAGNTIAGGYMSVTSDGEHHIWYCSAWKKVNAGFVQGAGVSGSSVYDITSTRQQYQDYYYVKGSLIGYATSSNSNQYPNDSYTGSTWYTKLGSDSIDAKSVTIPSEIKGGTNITISIEPATGLLGSTTISYVIQYRFNNGTWITLTTTTTTQYTLSVPMDTQTVQVRVQAKDNAGFTSTDYTTSETVSVTNGDPPVVSSDLGSSPYDMGQVSEPFTFEYTITDPDYGDSATVKETL